MNRPKFRVIAALILGGAWGCASPGISLLSYNDGLERIRMGMTKEEIRRVFPTAVPRGAKRYPTGAVDVLEVDIVQHDFYPVQGYVARNNFTGAEAYARWFYFFNDQLIQYGDPNDWPASPESKIEFGPK